MEILCSSCRKRIDIPDEKIPQVAKFTFICPYCKERVTVDTSTLAPPAEDPGREPAVSAANDESVQVELDSFPPGSRVAFFYVQDPGWMKVAEDFFRQAGFFCVIPQGAGEAREKLRLQHHDVVMVEDSEEAATLLAEIHRWRGLRRRESNVILLGSGASSLHADEAFIRGVNTYLNLHDVNRAGDLFDACLKGYDLGVGPWLKAGDVESGGA